MTRNFTIRWGWLVAAMGMAAVGALALRLSTERACAAGDVCDQGSAVDTIGALLVLAATLAGVAWAVRRAVLRWREVGDTAR